MAKVLISIQCDKCGKFTTIETEARAFSSGSGSYILTQSGFKHQTFDEGDGKTILKYHCADCAAKYDALLEEQNKERGEFIKSEVM